MLSAVMSMMRRVLRAEGPERAPCSVAPTTAYHPSKARSIPATEAGGRLADVLHRSSIVRPAHHSSTPAWGERKRGAQLAPHRCQLTVETAARSAA